MSNQSASDRNAAKREAERRECIGATFRAFWYAVRGEVPPENFYGMDELKRAEWIERGLAAATVTGL